MKSVSVKILLLSSILAFWSCGNKSSEHEHGHDHDGHDVEVSGNQELYNKVMEIHDEVMPKMDDIRRYKSKLKDSVENTKTLTPEQRAQLNALYAKLDSAGDGMMVWMREFRPLPDSLGEEKAREYLENEMERVKRVRSSILAALEQAERK